MKKSFSRRDFLRIVSAGTCGAALHNVLAPKNGFMAFASPLALGAPNPRMVLVVVNLAGGCSYNIAPIYHGAYRDKNPTISYGPENSLPLNSEQGLHPALTAVKSEFDAGHVALLNLVGYENPNRSHKESTDRWFEGEFQNGTGMGSGWGARLSCQVASTFSTISLGGDVGLLNGGCSDGRTFGDLQNFGESRLFGSDDASQWMRDARDYIISTTPARSDSLSYVKTAMEKTAASIDTIKNATNFNLPVTFPTSGFGNSCRDAAKLIAAGDGIGTRLIYLERGGFDTHSDERPDLTNNLTDVNNSLDAFIRCAKAMGFWDRTVIITMSEFCRTFENGSRGTDHGHAAPMLVLGGAVRGGVKNPAPSPAQTVGAYYSRYDIDYREPFKAATIAMGLDADAIFPGRINAKNIDLL